MSLAGRDASKNGGRDLKLVRVIYIDEAGSNREERIFTWATIIVKDSRWLAVERDAERIIETLVPEELQQDFEFHACDIFTGTNLWQRWRNQDGKALRFKILKEFVALIPKHKLPITECSFSKDAKATRETLRFLENMAFAIVIDIVERWFVACARRDVGMLIADVRTREGEALFKKEIRRARKISRAGVLAQLRHIVDAIHFADSRESIGLQLADSCAYFIKRHRVAKLNDEAEQFYKMLAPNIYHSSFIDDRGPVEATVKS